MAAIDRRSGSAAPEPEGGTGLARLEQWAGSAVDVETAVVPRFDGGGMGSTTYGDVARLRGSVAERSRDVRWSVRCVVARVHGRVAGVLPISLSRTAQAPDPYLRAALPTVAAGLEDARGVLFLGTHAELLGGAVVRRHHDRLLDDIVLRALVDHATRVARDEGLRAVAPFVPTAQTLSFHAAFGPDAVTVPAEVRSELVLAGSAGLDGFLARLPKRERQTLRSDLRRLTKLSVRAEPLPPTPDLIDAAAELVARVKQRHGIPDHPRLARGRIAHWLETTDGEPVVFSIHESTGPQAAVVAGACVASRTPDALLLHELGLADSGPRHERYLELAFHAPLRYALDHGTARIDLGAGHAVVKRNRGARQELTWHLAGPAGTRT